MRAGRVVQVRLSPTDCMSVVDIVRKIGAFVPGMSFSVAAKIAFASLIESARQNGVIDKRDGFEYNEVMKDFMEQNYLARGRKLQITEVINTHNFTPRPIVPETPERVRRRTRFNELKFQFDTDPHNHPLPEPGTPEFNEWVALCDEFADTTG